MGVVATFALDGRRSAFSIDPDQPGARLAAGGNVDERAVRRDPRKAAHPVENGNCLPDLGRSLRVECRRQDGRVLFENEVTRG